LCCCFPSSRSHTQHSTAQCYSPPKSTCERKEEAGTNYRGPEFRNGARRPGYVAYVFVFFASIRCNLVVICLVDGICGQQPCCVLRCPFRFLTFPLAGKSEPSLGSPSPAQHHIRPTNCKNFLPDGEKRFHARVR